MMGPTPKTGVVGASLTGDCHTPRQSMVVSGGSPRCGGTHDEAAASRWANQSTPAVLNGAVLPVCPHLAAAWGASAGSRAGRRGEAAPAVRPALRGHARLKKRPRACASSGHVLPNRRMHRPSRRPTRGPDGIARFGGGRSEAVLRRSPIRDRSAPADQGLRVAGADVRRHRPRPRSPAPRGTPHPPGPPRPHRPETRSAASGLLSPTMRGHWPCLRPSANPRTRRRAKGSPWLVSANVWETSGGIALYAD